ncbi:MAG: LamG domain-containing protein, partial [Dehalococcoidia bacterium]
ELEGDLGVVSRSFDGVDDLVIVPDSATLDGMTALSVEACIFPEAYPTDHNGDGIVLKWGPGFVQDDSYKLHLASSGVAIWSVSAGGTPDQVNSPDLIPLNRWTHLTGTYEAGGEVRLYVNGQLVANKAAAIPAVQDTLVPVWIGRSNTDTGNVFDGVIDEVRISRVVRVPPPPLVPFAAFAPEAQIKFGPLANDDEFQVRGTFTLRAASDGIDPLTEDVMLGVGTFATTIPAGSFQLRVDGSFRFEGLIDGVALQMRVLPLGGSDFAFKAQGAGADLTGTANPVPIELTIGNDTGMTSVIAEIQ